MNWRLQAVGPARTANHWSTRPRCSAAYRRAFKGHLGEMPPPLGAGRKGWFGWEVGRESKFLLQVQKQASGCQYPSAYLAHGNAYGPSPTLARSLAGPRLGD